MSYSIYGDVLNAIDVKKVRFEICNGIHTESESYFQKELLGLSFVDGTLIHAILNAPHNEELIDSLVFTEVVKSLKFQLNTSVDSVFKHNCLTFALLKRYGSEVLEILMRFGSSVNKPGLVRKYANTVEYRKACVRVRRRVLYIYFFARDKRYDFLTNNNNNTLKKVADYLCVRME